MKYDFILFGNLLPLSHFDYDLHFFTVKEPERVQLVPTKDGSGKTIFVRRTVTTTTYGAPGESGEGAGDPSQEDHFKTAGKVR